MGRCLIIQSSRPSLVPELEETIGMFEMSIVPRSLCAPDGSLYIPKDKASLMHFIVEAQNEHLENSTSINDHNTSLNTSQPDQEKDDSSPMVLVLDAMAILQSMKKTSSMLNILDLRSAFIKRIEKMVEK